jgi:hypothetical protein
MLRYPFLNIWFDIVYCSLCAGSAKLGGGVGGWLVPSEDGGGLGVRPGLLDGATTRPDRSAEILM